MNPAKASYKKEYLNMPRFLYQDKKAGKTLGEGNESRKNIVILQYTD
jgi:hypothetical protein